MTYSYEDLESRWSLYNAIEILGWCKLHVGHNTPDRQTNVYARSDVEKRVKLIGDRFMSLASGIEIIGHDGNRSGPFSWRELARHRG